MDVTVLDDVATESRTPMLNRVVEGSLDFKGGPSVRSKSGSWRSAYYILGAEMVERVAFLGIRSNLVSYLTGPMGQSTATAAVNVNVWTGVADLSPFLGAFVGDAILGRYWAVVVASVFFALGLGGLSLSAALHSSNDCKNNTTCSPSRLHDISFISSLYLVALMQGVHRPCLQAFGADQFDDDDAKESKAKASFFNWWNFSLSTGALIAYSVISYVQDNLGWALGFGIQSAAMLLSLLFFSLGTLSYRLPATASRNERNLFSITGSIIGKAVSRWRGMIPHAASTEAAQQIMPSGDTQFKFLGKALLSSDGSHDNDEACSSTDEIGNAKPILKLLPLWFTCLGLAIINSQTATLFTKQGATMERYITSNFQIPAASLQSFLTITMLLLLPLYDLAFIPMARAIRKNTIGITVLQRAGTGQFLSIIAMLIAAFVEQKRLTVAFEHGLVDRPNETVPMSIWWLVPQYLVLGSAFCFSLAGLQEFFYDQVPAEMKSVGLALYLSIFGIGNFLSSFLISVIEKATTGAGKDSWFSDNLNRAHLDYFYLLLAGISLVEFVAYIYFAKSYVYTMKHNIAQETVEC